MGNKRKYFYQGVPEEPGYYVYELWAGFVCLYVGRVGNSGPGLMYSRLGGHRTDKPWWHEVTDIVVSAFTTHDEIAAEEPRRIYELQPVFNRTYAAKCKRGHPKPFIAQNHERVGTGCQQCVQEWVQSPERQAWRREYNQRPEVKQRITEYHALPEVHAQRLAYWRKYAALPRVKAKAHAREVGHARKSYYDRRNALPEVKDRKRRWAFKATRRPGPGQAGLF